MGAGWIKAYVRTLRLAQIKARPGRTRPNSGYSIDANLEKVCLNVPHLIACHTLEISWRILHHLSCPEPSTLQNVKAIGRERRERRHSMCGTETPLQQTLHHHNRTGVIQSAPRIEGR